MDFRQNNNISQRSLYSISFLALSIHAVLLLIFAWLHVTLMVYVNVGSILCYVFCFPLIKKWRIKVCIYTAFTEVLTHAVFAVLSVGTGLGFQLYFINCIATMFLADYLSMHLGSDSIGSLKLGIVSALLYIITLIVARFHEPIYSIDEDIAFICTILNTALTLTLILMFFNMLAKMASSYEKALAKQASYDNLTGLVNRHYLIEYMDGVYTSGNLQRYWLAIVDIDNFKTVNDKYGHLCGDFVLKSVADILKKACGDRMVCRWGGEEFMVVGITTGQGGKDGSGEAALLEDIRQNIASRDFVYDNSTSVKLTVTIGMAYYQSNQTLNEWFSVADGRLYEGKRAGKNRIVTR